MHCKCDGCIFFIGLCLPVGNELTGNTNLITHYNLEHAYNRFCGKKVKEKLSNFLPELPGGLLWLHVVILIGLRLVKRLLFPPNAVLLNVPKTS